MLCCSLGCGNTLNYIVWMPAPQKVKGRVWSKIMFCVWLAFAVKIVMAMTAELNLAWFTRYEPRNQTVMTSLPSPSLGRALYNTMAFDPRMVLEEPNFATIEQNHIILFSVCCRHSILHVYEILFLEMKFLQKLGSSKTFRGSNAIVHTVRARVRETAVTSSPSSIEARIS